MDGRWFNALRGLPRRLTHDVGIDLGTANTLVLVRGQGIVVNEPSVVALHRRTRRVLAVGQAARRMYGLAPRDILVIRPLHAGVIYDFEVAEQLLRYCIRQACQGRSLGRRARVVVGIPAGVTEVEKRAVHDAALGAGTREAWLIAEPMAAAIGAGLPVTEPAGCMIVDIGGGTTEVAVIALGGIVAQRSLRIAGDQLDQDIVHYLRQHHHLLVGERTAEAIKIAIGRALPPTDGQHASTVARGKDLHSGTPREVEISTAEVVEAISSSVQAIADAVVETLEETPPELQADLLGRGITLVGGGALLRGWPELLAARTGMPVRVAEEPLGCVVRGAGRVLGELDTLRRVLLDLGAPRRAGWR
ncbi:MAG TPA: rod shape-determining protein [Chloroflexota bacterium]|jgi:rod shape-determining protein MreB|nr:rod shape-determining protein [Chloroflexota bacterium]